MRGSLKAADVTEGLKPIKWEASRRCRGNGGENVANFAQLQLGAMPCRFE